MLVSSENSLASRIPARGVWTHSLKPMIPKGCAVAHLRAVRATEICQISLCDKVNAFLLLHTLCLSQLLQWCLWLLLWGLLSLLLSSPISCPQVAPVLPPSLYSQRCTLLLESGQADAQSHTMQLGSCLLLFLGSRC